MHIHGEDNASPSTVDMEMPWHASTCKLKPAKNEALSTMPVTVCMRLRDHEMLYPSLNLFLNAMLQMNFTAFVFEEHVWLNVLHAM
jgi:hypothetical protein